MDTNMSMETKIAALKTKLRQLSIRVDRTKTMLDSDKLSGGTLKHYKLLKKKTNKCKHAVKAVKIAMKEDLAQINKWSDEIDCKFEAGDEEKHG